MSLLYSLIETIWWFLQPSHWLTILKVGGGLSFVIFVHELGHFLVAKACGVRCDKFYVGFDWPLGRGFDWLLSLPLRPFGRKVKFFQYFIPDSLVKFKYGETTYGIGIVPLGGYVKMLGQDDDPSHASAEMKILERQRKLEAAGETVPAEERISDERARELLDPRSYQTKSVPQRLAIITAGVIMNVIFAFLMAVLAYSLGVDKGVTEIGRVHAGGPAWKAGLQPGDKVTSIAGEPVQYFEDLMAHVQFKNLDNPTNLPFVVKRDGVAEPITLKITPDTSRGAPAILVSPASSLKIAGVDPFSKYGEMTQPDLDPEKRPKDKDIVTKVNGVRVESHVAWEKLLRENRGKPITITVERQAQDQPTGDTAVKTEELTFELPAEKKRVLGLIMTLGPVVSVQPDSPAALAGIRVGDRLLELDGQPIGDPQTLEERLQALAGKPVKLTVETNTISSAVSKLLGTIAESWGQDYKPLASEPSIRTIELTPRALDRSSVSETTLPLESIGVCCDVTPTISAIVPGSPADKAKLKVGQTVTDIALLEAAKPLPGKLFAVEETKPPIPIMQNASDVKKLIWPSVEDLIQDADPSRKVKLFIKSADKDEKTTEVILEPELSAEEYALGRGLYFYGATVPVKYTLGEAISQGFKTTGEKLMMVVGFLRQIGGRISPKNLGGPVAIATQAGMAANSGFSSLLLFLVMLSANLAVVNMLPIPVLDGGHVVFLLYEWVTGKPMPANVFAILLNIGVLLLMTLMLFVLGLDFGLISRR
jgi:regulator of sigma E protease